MITKIYEDNLMLESGPQSFNQSNGDIVQEDTYDKKGSLVKYRIMLEVKNFN